MDDLQAIRPDRVLLPRKRGFAAMDPARQREIAGQGGRKAHALGKAHRFTSAEAQAAGKKGAAARRQRAVIGESTPPSVEGP